MVRIFGKEKKGMNCNPNPDGSVTCKRIQRDKKGGELITDGQEVTISADPSNGCKPRFDGSMQVMDDEWDAFDGIADRVSAGCKKQGSEKGE